MRISRFVSPAFAVCLLAGTMAATGYAQGQPNDEAPKNLQVLPKDMTRQQVVQVMRGWEGALGADCSTCHAEYADHRKNARGRAELDFSSDAKPEKRIARIMYQMVQTDRKDFLSKVNAMDQDHAADQDDAQLTCGTCHRGHVMPEKFVPPQREEGRPGGAPRGF